MSYINEIEFDLTVGAQYELSPIEMLYLIGRVLAVGGNAVIEGNVLIITEMPGQESLKSATEPEPPVEATIAPEPEPEPQPLPPVVQEAPVEVKPAPIKRAPKPKAEEPKVEPVKEVKE